MLFYSLAIALYQITKKVGKNHISSRNGATPKKQFELNSTTPIHVKIRLDGQEVFNSQSQPPINNLSSGDLGYIEKALDLQLGQAPDDFKRNVRVKLKDKEVFLLQDGVVKVNEFQPPKNLAQTSTYETTINPEAVAETAPQASGEPKTIDHTHSLESTTNPPIQDLNHGEKSPQQLQAERTVQVAPIVRSFLEAHECHHKQGNVYAATWDKSTQTLALMGNNQLKLLAKFHKGQWQPVPIPLAEKQPNLNETDLNHFEQLAPKIEAKREKARAAYRQWYLDSKATVTEHNPALRDAQKVDLAIATTVLEQTKTPTDVGRILSQSDVAVAIREHEPNSYVATEKVYNYVNDLYQLAARELEQQQRFQQHKQQDVQVEIEV